MKILPQLSLALLASTASAYVVPKPNLPRHKQVQWLNEMTENICHTAPGGLTHELLIQAHECMGAWSHLDSAETAMKVEVLAKRVVDERLAGNLEAEMNVQDYNWLIEGWARSKSGAQGARRCEQILYEMQAHGINPNRDSFKSTLMAWRQSNDKDACLHAQRILEYMIELYTSGENPHGCPDADCFDVVLQLWARSGRKDAPKKTQQLVLGMENLYRASDYKKIKPRTSSFNSVLAAWAKCKHSKSASKHIFEVLEFMEKSLESGDKSMAPDLVSYSTAIGALARNKGDMNVAEALLNKVEEKYKAGDEKFLPDSIIYNSLISCVARSNQQGAFRKSRSLLNRQMRLVKAASANGKTLPVKQKGKKFSKGITPDVYGFTSVLAACAMEKEEKSKAFEVALATFQELRNNEKYGRPNHVTYGTMMKCCALLLSKDDPSRRKWVKKVWNMCVEDGCVGEMALSRFREASPNFYKDAMRGVDKRNLPSGWTRNVKGELDRKTRKQHLPKRKYAEV